MNTFMLQLESQLFEKDKEYMLDFSMEKLCSEVEDRAPMLHTVLSAAAINRRSRAETVTQAARFGAVGMAAAVCLRNQSRYMIAVQFLITNFLHHSNWLVGTKIFNFSMFCSLSLCNRRFA